MARADRLGGQGQGRLDQQLDPKHPLFRLAQQIDWSYFEQEFGAFYSEEMGRPGAPTRLLVGLHYLKHAYNESDESVVEKWVENPYWQYFCGYEYFQHELPCHPTSLVKWRQRIKADGVEKMLKEILSTAARTHALNAKDVESVNVDTTGKNELRLVVTNGGNSISYDHADWADAKVTCGSGGGGDTTPPTVTSVTPTEGATGVAPILDGSAILYTLPNDTRIYRRALGSGEALVVHDFGAEGIARDVHAVGNRVVAVVGGRVAFSVHPRLGPVQWDSGGVLHVFDLEGTGSQSLDTPGRLYRRPALSPDGSRIVAEGFPFIITHIDQVGDDTIVSKSGDVYLFGGER